MLFMTRGRARREDLAARQTEWERRPPTASPHERSGIHDCYSIPLPLPQDGDGERLARRAFDALMTYDIFPPDRMHARVCSADGRVRTGVTIVQRIVAGVVAIEAAVRVVDVFETSAANTARGFSYVTLAGHAERGLATFTLDVDHDGALSFKIETWSRPAGVAGAVMAPLSRQLQKRFTREALLHFRDIVTAPG
ncbi:MAG TPA: DUF1990 family protein [Polyangia bacterium]|jgi:uncharacterized protein (UPF0548 family)